MRTAIGASALVFLLWFGTTSALAEDMPAPPPENSTLQETPPAVEPPQFQPAPDAAPVNTASAEQAQPTPSPADPAVAPPNPQPQAAANPPPAGEGQSAAPVTAAVEQPPKVQMPASIETPKATEPDQFLAQATEAYKAGELKKSLGLIDKAQLAIRAKHVELYRPLLPPTPKDWVADDGSDSKMTFDTSMVGGMSVISRKYSASGYTVKIGYIIDSPMMGFISGLMKMVSSMNTPDGSMEVVQGNQALYKENDDGKHKESAHQLMVMAGEVVVVIQSETLPKETLLQFANIVPYEQLKTVQ